MCLLLNLKLVIDICKILFKLQRLKCILLILNSRIESSVSCLKSDRLKRLSLKRCLKCISCTSISFLCLKRCYFWSTWCVQLKCVILCLGKSLSVTLLIYRIICWILRLSRAHCKRIKTISRCFIGGKCVCGKSIRSLHSKWICIWVRIIRCRLDFVGSQLKSIFTLTGLKCQILRLNLLISLKLAAYIWLLSKLVRSHFVTVSKGIQTTLPRFDRLSTWYIWRCPSHTRFWSCTEAYSFTGWNTSDHSVWTVNCVEPLEIIVCSYSLKGICIESVHSRVSSSKSIICSQLTIIRLVHSLEIKFMLSWLHLSLIARIQKWILVIQISTKTVCGLWFILSKIQLCLTCRPCTSSNCKSIGISLSISISLSVSSHVIWRRRSLYKWWWSKLGFH